MEVPIIECKSVNCNNKGPEHKHSNRRKESNPTELFDSKRNINKRRGKKDYRLKSYIQPKLIRLKPSTKEKIECLIKTSHNLFDDKIKIKYDRIQDSIFKRDFLKIITGNFADNLEKCVVNKCNIEESNDNLDICLLAELNVRKTTDKYKEMLAFRKKLPAFEKKEEIVDLISNNQIVIISGNTGSGKTTQIPQFILDYEIECKRGSSVCIICSAPRRISVISIAERVALERAEKLGNSVGYHIRLESSRASILFCTTGMILQYMQSDPSLGKYSHVILDEVHERGKQNDMLLTLLKEIVKKRPDLKVILMSATLDSEKFSGYFNECPLLQIPGMTYPVKVNYFEDIITLVTPFITVVDIMDASSYQRILIELADPKSECISYSLIVALIKNINCNEGPGAILIFLPGLNTINTLYQYLIESFPCTDKYVIYTLHSSLPTIEQKSIFEKPEPGVRKIIIATNIAESSITIDDVVYVIDSGKAKYLKVNKFNVETLHLDWISKASADQRTGRAGRIMPGKCYRLYSKAQYDKFSNHNSPEILSTNLEELILQIKMLQLGQVKPFLATLIDSPDESSINASIHLLKQLNALDQNETLTALGYHLAQFSVHPRIGKMLIWAAIFSCVEPIFAIAACLSFKEPFYTPIEKKKKEEAKERKIELELCANNFSDLLIYAELLKRFQQENNDKRSFCTKYFVSYYTLKSLLKAQDDFAHTLNKMELLDSANKKDKLANKNSYNKSLQRAIIATGLYPNVATILGTTGRKNHRIMLTDEGQCSFTSVNREREGFPSPYFMYYSSKNYSNSTYLIDTTCVSSVALLFAAPARNIFSRNYSINFNPKVTVNMLQKLFTKLDKLINYRMLLQPSSTNWDDVSKKFLNVVIEVLYDYDEYIGLDSGRLKQFKKISNT